MRLLKQSSDQSNGKFDSLVDEEENSSSDSESDSDEEMFIGVSAILRVYETIVKQ